MTSCGEKLCYASSVESSLGKTKGSTQTSATGSDYDSIVLVVDNWVLGTESRADLGFSCAQRCTCNDLCYRSCGGEVACALTEGFREL